MSTNPSKPDFYPRLKVANRWLLIVPEIQACRMCALAAPDSIDSDGFGECRYAFSYERNERPPGSPNERLAKLDCGDMETIYIRPKDFEAWLTTQVVQKLEDT